jgi:hypothetical protein
VSGRPPRLAVFATPHSSFFSAALSSQRHPL